MPGLLSRSKSMRLLKGHRKDTHQEQAQNSMPRLSGPQTDNDRYHSPTPILRAEGKLDPPEVAVRPNTSSGPGDRRTLFHMKTNHAASNHSQNDLTFSQPLESPTLLYTQEVTGSQEGIIGIALGSPTTGSHWTSTPQASTVDIPAQSPHEYTTAPMEYNSFPSPPPGRQEAPKSKLGRWKSLFRKAPPVPPPQDKPAFYQLTQNVAAGPRAVRADSHHDSESIESHAKISHEQHAGRTPSPPTFKANIRASRTFTTPRSPPEGTRTRARAFTAGTLPANPRASVQRSATTPLPANLATKDFPPVPHLKSFKSDQNTPTLSTDKPLLDVSIPDITLDRYSVMFNNLLQSNANRKSNLLARRQSNAKKLKPLNELTVKEAEQESPMDYKLQRRATSPRMPSPSPRLSLFPNTNNRAASPRSASVPRAAKTLHRSKTAPEKSPLRQTFSRAEERAEEDNKKGQALFIQKPTASPNLKPQPSPIAKLQHLAMTPTSISSFESDNDSVTIVVGRTAPGLPQKYHLDEREPEWEIISKPTSVARANTTPLVRTDSQRQPKVTKFSALSSNPASAPLEAPSPLQRIQQLQTPPQSARAITTSENHDDGKARAMVGVARSISVSRANSPRTLVRTASELKSPGDRLVERHGQALTPTMVEVRNRRSQRVQLVDA
ncbi:hypothetical protein FB567DRAFT_215963 [Paraphoma chrysanthemicola]|uniref:Uncharacterized protein n=1 Tax=Paraphoma chrysanthemicola TaxID=798071 RepID=A0A8K0VSB9_9PLEO|nr:hypothetical protein FB567DRAFT_215963 [Paraphoma chrysanthemicola]